LQGLGEMKARRERWFRSGRISVSVGTVLQPEPSGSPEELTKVLERGVFTIPTAPGGLLPGDTHRPR
jgi:hypothetical protein